LRKCSIASPAAAGHDQHIRDLVVGDREILLPARIVRIEPDKLLAEWQGSPDTPQALRQPAERDQNLADELMALCQIALPLTVGRIAARQRLLDCEALR
jgi:hypothetical protein